MTSNMSRFSSSFTTARAYSLSEFDDIKCDQILISLNQIRVHSETV